MYLEKDIFLIYKLAFNKAGNKVYILDPQKQIIRNYKESGFNYIRTREDITRLAKEKHPYILINISGARTFNFPLNFEKVEGIISFNRFLEVSELFYHHELFYSKRKNRSMAWVYDRYYRDHDFLLDTEEFETVIDMYNLVSFFPSTLKYFRLWLGDIKGVSDGQIQILSKKDRLFENLPKEETKAFSIRLSSAATTDIISLMFKKRKKINKILKIAVTKNARELLNNENKIFHELAKTGKEKFDIQIEDDHSLLVFPENTRKLTALQIQKSHHPMLLTKIIQYNKSFQDKINLVSFFKKTDTLRSLDVIKLKLSVKNYPKGLSIYNFTNIFTNLTKIFNSFTNVKSIPVSLANQSIRPDTTCYYKDDVFITSWSKQEKQYPLLYDLFDIEFKRQEKYEHPEVEKLIADIEYLKSNEEVQEFLQQAHTDFETQLMLYLIVRLPREMVLTLSKDKIVPEQNLKFYLWSEFFKYYRPN